jgi:hypothetical protein
MLQKRNIPATSVIKRCIGTWTFGNSRIRTTHPADRTHTSAMNLQGSPCCVVFVPEWISMSTSNFKNPVGLVFRMLTSGSRAAWAALLHEGLRLLARPIDLLLQGREKRLLKESGTGNVPMILVVGAPRSGTTLVYQTLARYLDVSYVSNLTSLFPHSPLSGTRMFRWLPQTRSADFRNFYGQTAHLNGPNDGFCLWNRWLGKDRYVPRTELSELEQQSIQGFFQAWHRQFGKPFLNKNNRNTGCLDLLSRLFPDATFVVVRRNPVLVAQSLIKAREQVQGDKSVGWGLHSQSSDTDRDRLSYVDDVCAQILQIEEQLDEQLSQIPKSRLIEFTYEGFCEDPVHALESLADRIPHASLKCDLIGAELQPFAVSAQVTLTHEELERLQAVLKAGRIRSTGRTALTVTNS